MIAATGWSSSSLDTPGERRRSSSWATAGAGGLLSIDQLSRAALLRSSSGQVGMLSILAITILLGAGQPQQAVGQRRNPAVSRAKCK
jgi:hypothetical protein